MRTPNPTIARRLLAAIACGLLSVGFAAGCGDDETDETPAVQGSGPGGGDGVGGEGKPATAAEKDAISTAIGEHLADKGEFQIGAIELDDDGDTATVAILLGDKGKQDSITVERDGDTWKVVEP